jgi:transposase
VPAIPSCIQEPLWDQVAALLPTRQVHHPLGCHRQRIPDRVIFDKLIQILVNVHNAEFPAGALRGQLSK